MTHEQALARVEYLQDRVAELEDLLAHSVYARPHDVVVFQRIWRLTPTQAYLLSALYRAKGPCSTIDLDAVIPAPLKARRRDPEFRESNTINVFLCRLRERFGKDFIITSPGFGWSLSPQARQVLEKVIGRTIGQPVAGV